MLVKDSPEAIHRINVASGREILRCNQVYMSHDRAGFHGISVADAAYYYNPALFKAYQQAVVDHFADESLDVDPAWYECYALSFVEVHPFSTYVEAQLASHGLRLMGTRVPSDEEIAHLAKQVDATSIQ